MVLLLNAGLAPDTAMLTRIRMHDCIHAHVSMADFNLNRGASPSRPGRNVWKNFRPTGPVLVGPSRRPYHAEAEALHHRHHRALLDGWQPVAYVNTEARLAEAAWC